MPLVYNTNFSPPTPPTPSAGNRMQIVGGDSADNQQDTNTTSQIEAAPKDRGDLIRRLKAREARIWSLNTNNLEIDTGSNNPEPEDSNGPQSALHSGVFAPDSRQLQHPPSPINPHFHNPFLSSRHAHTEVAPAIQPHHTNLPQFENQARSGRSRAQSVSSLSGYVLKHPTSPLALSSSQTENESIDELSNPIDIWDTPLRRRRASLVPSLSSLHSSQSPAPPSYSRHASRRSISDNWYDSFPVAPSHSRQPSRRLSLGVGLGSDLPVGSFVGSYEESILNGRMSTTPSKPLQFLAQIGVLGLGKCKPSLRCPTHVTIPFPAYFYSVGDYDSPSPYVGQIDLDTALQTNSKPSKTFPEGGYRIPPRGQLQIIIKNPNKTAVKLFLVPYDLTDMQPGQKTFIRQKSYSADAYIDTLTMPGNVPITPVTAQRMRDKEREALRYLIHLHLCCPSKGRYYLHRNIRLVFANRVPDGKEKLRNEIQQPEPKYSPWKPGSNDAMPRRRRGSSISFSLAAEEFLLSDENRQRMNNFRFGAPMDSTNGTPSTIVGSNNVRTDAMDIAMEKDNDGDTPMGSAVGNEISESWDKLSSSVYLTASSKSERSQQGLLAMKLRSFDVQQFENRELDQKKVSGMEVRGKASKSPEA